MRLRNTPGTPRPQPGRTRAHPITVRLSDRELARLNEQCRLAGMPRERLVRCLLAGAELKPRPPDGYAELSRQVASLGRNLNQLAHIANLTGRAEAAMAAEALTVMREVHRLMQEAL